LDRTGGGYEQDTVFSDGPIIYGTGMSDADRQKAWKHFFMTMVKAVVSLQGQDALGVKLARRCLPDRDFCTTALDAKLVGIGGIQEPRKVIVIVTTDLHDHQADVSYSKVGVWSVAYLEVGNLNGCRAAAQFPDQTVFQMAQIQSGTDKAWIIFISNPR